MACKADGDTYMPRQTDTHAHSHIHMHAHVYLVTQIIYAFSEWSSSTRRMTTNDGDKAKHSRRRSWSWLKYSHNIKLHEVNKSWAHIQTQTEKVREIHTERERCLKWVSLAGLQRWIELRIEQDRNEKELNWTIESIVVELVVGYGCKESLNEPVRELN